MSAVDQSCPKWIPRREIRPAHLMCCPAEAPRDGHTRGVPVVPCAGQYDEGDRDERRCTRPQGRTDRRSSWRSVTAAGSRSRCRSRCPASVAHTGVEGAPAGAVVRVLDSGEITHRVETDLPCFSCALGGPGGPAFVSTVQRVRRGRRERTCSASSRQPSAESRLVCRMSIGSPRCPVWFCLGCSPAMTDTRWRDRGPIAGVRRVRGFVARAVGVSPRRRSRRRRRPAGAGGR